MPSVSRAALSTSPSASSCSWVSRRNSSPLGNTGKSTPACGSFIFALGSGAVQFPTISCTLAMISLIVAFSGNSPKAGKTTLCQKTCSTAGNFSRRNRDRNSPRQAVRNPAQGGPPEPECSSRQSSCRYFFRDPATLLHCSTAALWIFDFMCSRPPVLHNKHMKSPARLCSTYTARPGSGPALFTVLGLGSAGSSGASSGSGSTGQVHCCFSPRFS
mmetsp:Transcript_24699/g.64836  ORF Transcript_24699/g.64836 Transcript_24699/m.64836 type:complete len:216 (+) Transcript_24699:2091-2738(+)